MDSTPGAGVSNPPKKVEHAVWTTARDGFLIHCLQIQVNQGNRFDTAFKRQAWDAVVREFNENYGTSFSKDQLKAHYQFLRSQFYIVQELRGHSGFGWNEQTSMVVAPESVWSEYLKSHPKARLYKDRGFPLYNELAELFGGFSPTGSNRKSTGQATQQNETQSLPQDGVVESQSATNSQHMDEDIQVYPGWTSTPRGSSMPILEATPRLEADLVPKSIELRCGQGDRFHTGRKCDRCPSMMSHRLRVRTNGSLAHAEAIHASAAMEEWTACEQPEREQSRKLDEVLLRRDLIQLKQKELEIQAEEMRLQHQDKKAKLEGFPNMRQAMSVFSELSGVHFSGQEEVEAAKLLKNEENAAFFVSLPSHLRWNWLKQELESQK